MTVRVKIVVPLFATFLFALVAIPAQNPSGCLAYEPVVVQLKGTIIRKTFPGAPNYASVKHGDRPEVAWLLVLVKPICMQEDLNDRAMNISQTDIRKIQIGFDEADVYNKYNRFVGEKVVATGTLFGSHTGHHRTPVLMTVKTLSKSD